MSNTEKHTGSKFDATRNLPLSEVAKMVRKDIKAAVKAGKLPKGIKVSVRTQRGYSLDCEIKAVPFNPSNLDRVVWDIAAPANSNDCPPVLLSEEAYKVLRTVEEIVAAYNRSEVDYMTDYHNNHFFASVKFDYELREAGTAAHKRSLGVA